MGNDQEKLAQAKAAVREKMGKELKDMTKIRGAEGPFRTEIHIGGVWFRTRLPNGEELGPKLGDQAVEALGREEELYRVGEWVRPVIDPLGNTALD